jgi:NAD(P)-dependent dehydrogenase (short-subunit alcohol dehydrogenase family)
MARLNWSPSSLPPLNGRTYIVTGGNTGIGYWTVHHLAKHGATVYMTCRTAEKATAALSALLTSIQKSDPSASITPDIRPVTMDLMSLSAVRDAATKILAEVTSLHGVVNSAGIMATPYAMSEDGYESQFQTNYLSHWLLTYLVLPLLESTAAREEPGVVRIVNVSSIGHAAAPKEGVNLADTALAQSFTFRRYGQSKLANILHAKSLHARYTGGGRDRLATANNKIWALSLHPGNVDTQLNTRSVGSALVPVLRCLGVYITPEEGSYNSLWAVASPGVTAEMSGEYFVPVGVKKDPSKLARDAQLADRLWEWTEQEMRSKGFIH